MVKSNFSEWHEGTLETIAMTIAPWLGVWVGMAAVVATLGEFNVVMACSSRALWATADYKMLPSFLAIEWERFETPVAAVIFQTITTGMLMNFSFEILVVIDTFFNKYVAVACDPSLQGEQLRRTLTSCCVMESCSLTLMLEFFAFLRLKYVEKDTERPFVVPFGSAGAWASSPPMYARASCEMPAYPDLSAISGVPSIHSDWCVCMPEPLSPKIGFGMKVTVFPCRRATFLTTYL